MTTVRSLVKGDGDEHSWLPHEGTFRGQTIYSIRPLTAAERGQG